MKPTVILYCPKCGASWREGESARCIQPTEHQTRWFKETYEEVPLFQPAGSP